MEAGAIGDRKQGVSETPSSWARGDFSAFFQNEKDAGMRKNQGSPMAFNRGQRRDFRAELGIDDGEEKMSI